MKKSKISGLNHIQFIEHENFSSHFHQSLTHDNHRKVRWQVAGVTTTTTNHSPRLPPSSPFSRENPRSLWQLFRPTMRARCVNQPLFSFFSFSGLKTDADKTPTTKYIQLAYNKEGIITTNNGQWTDCLMKRNSVKSQVSS